MTDTGFEAWSEFLEGKSARPVESLLVGPDAGGVGLADFPMSATGSPVLSSRALALMGEACVARSVALDIPGHSGYRLARSWKADDFLESTGRRYTNPLRRKSMSSSPEGRLLQFRHPFAAPAGVCFVTADTWARIEASHLTGLVKVGEYEVLEPA